MTRKPKLLSLSRRSVLAAPALLVGLLLAAWTHGSPPASYSAKAVVFSNWLELTKVLSLSNSPQITVSTWLYSNDISSAPVFWQNEPGLGFPVTNVAEIGYNFSSDVGLALTAHGASPLFSFGSGDGLFTTAAWHHIFFSADTNHSAGAKIAHLYIDGVDVLDPANTSDSGAAFSIGLNNSRSAFPETDGATIYASDTQMWFGQAIDPGGGNIGKFINGGKPVNPSVAAAAFGQQSVLFAGDHTNFATNQGSIGSYFLARWSVGFGLSSPPGAMSLTHYAVVSGDVVSQVVDNTAGLDVTSDFESVISVDGQIQQTSSTSYNNDSISVFTAAPLTDAPTHP